jgi:hypothetical protein
MSKRQLAASTVRQHSPKTHHIDRRAHQVIAAANGGADDDLLSCAELAEWFGVSKQWLEIGRIKNYGPTFRKLGPHQIRYRRGDVLKWLDARAFSNTAEYTAKRSA